jgi:hypothetical protein
MRNTVAAFQRDLTAFARSLGDESRNLVQREAEKLVVETRAASPIPPAYRVTIGGKASRIEDGPLGKLALGINDAVELYFDHRREVAEQTWLELRAQSPVDTGNYMESFVLYVNHEAVGQPNEGYRLIVPGARVEIINVMPYARRLEVGKQRDGSPFVVQTPPGMVERSVSIMQKGRYRKLADVFFTFADLSDAAINKGTLVGTRYVNNLGKTVVRRNDKDRRAGTRITYPMVILGEHRYGVRRR